MNRPASPRRGDVWSISLDPTRGREQAGVRPALILSSDTLNSPPGELVIVVPFTTRDRGLPTHVEVMPPEGGLTKTSYALCEAVRSVSKSRLLSKWGRVSDQSLATIEKKVRFLIGP